MLSSYSSYLQDAANFVTVLLGVTIFAPRAFRTVVWLMDKHDGLCFWILILILLLAGIADGFHQAGYF